VSPAMVLHACILSNAVMFSQTPRLRRTLCVLCSRSCVPTRWRSKEGTKRGTSSNFTNASNGLPRGSAEQLVLEDDPNFLPELDLVPMDLDQLDTEVTTPANSGRSTLAPHDSQITIGSQQIGGLIIPGRSASSMIGGSVSGYGGFSSVRGDSAAGMRRDTGGLLDDDEVGITIMPDGSMQMSDPAIPTVGGEQNDPVRREEDPGLERDAVSIAGRTYTWSN